MLTFLQFTQCNVEMINSIYMYMYIIFYYNITLSTTHENANKYLVKSQIICYLFVFIKNYFVHCNPLKHIFSYFKTSYFSRNIPSSKINVFFVKYRVKFPKYGGIDGIKHVYNTQTIYLLYLW